MECYKKFIYSEKATYSTAEERILWSLNLVEPHYKLIHLWAHGSSSYDL